MISLDKYRKYSLTPLLLISYAACRYSAGASDVTSWATWSKRFHNLGFKEGYLLNLAPYPPGSTLINSFFIYSTNMDPKLILDCILAVVVTIFMYVAWKEAATSILPAFLLIYIPTVIGGWIDIYFALPLLLSLKYIETERYLAAGICFQISILMKYQPLLFLPFILLFILLKARISGVLYFCSPAILVWPIVAFIFGPSTWIETLKLAVLKANLSGQALNIGWILTYLQHRGIDVGAYPRESVISMRPIYLDVHGHPYLFMKIVLYAVLLLLTLRFLMRTKKEFSDLMVLLISVGLAYYLCSPGVHLNHIMLIAAPTVLLSRRKELSWFSLLSLFMVADLPVLIFYGLNGVTSLDPLIGQVRFSVIATPFVMSAIIYLLLAFNRNVSRNRLT